MVERADSLEKALGVVVRRVEARTNAFEGFLHRLFIVSDAQLHGGYMPFDDFAEMAEDYVFSNIYSDFGLIFGKL